MFTARHVAAMLQCAQRLGQNSCIRRRCMGSRVFACEREVSQCLIRLLDVALGLQVKAALKRRSRR